MRWVRAEILRRKRSGIRVAAKGKASGFVAPKPFMRPAFDGTKSQVMGAITRTLERGIARQTKARAMMRGAA